MRKIELLVLLFSFFNYKQKCFCFIPILVEAEKSFEIAVAVVTLTRRDLRYGPKGTWNLKEVYYMYTILVANQGGQDDYYFE